MKIFFVSAIVLPFLFLSCTKSPTGLVVCELKKSDYTEMIRASGEIQAVNTVNIMAPVNYYGAMTVAWVISEGSQVDQGDTVCILESPAMMQFLEQQQQNLESLQAELKKLEADNALNRVMLDARVKENKAGMAISELDSVQMHYAPQAKKRILALELEKAHVEERKLLRKTEAEKKIDETEIRQLNSRIGQAASQVQILLDQVKSMTVVSPKGGIVARPQTSEYMVMYADGTVERGGSSFIKIGNQVSRRMPLMAIPDMVEMQVAVDVQEIDFKRIEKGQKVDILVDAAKALRTTGTVKRKSLQGKDSYSGVSKIKMYEVIIGVDSLHSLMPPGLSAHCEIFVSQVRDTVVVPTLAIFERDSLKIVYVANGDKFMPTPVETGSFNNAQTIVVKGLMGNETISLIEPPRKIIEKPKNSTHE
jgi:HlyD family secretion protein